jgi:hypothetical protein
LAGLSTGVFVINDSTKLDNKITITAMSGKPIWGRGGKTCVPLYALQLTCGIWDNRTNDSRSIGFAPCTVAVTCWRKSSDCRRWLFQRVPFSSVDGCFGGHNNFSDPVIVSVKVHSSYNGSRTSPGGAARELGYASSNKKLFCYYSICRTKGTVSLSNTDVALLLEADVSHGVRVRCRY